MRRLLNGAGGSSPLVPDCAVYELQLEEGGLLLFLAVACVIYTLLPAQRGLRIHGRFVAAGWQRKSLIVVGRKNAIDIEPDGTFRMLVHTGDSMYLGFHWNGELRARVRVEAGRGTAAGPARARFIDLGNIDLDQFVAEGSSGRVYCSEEDLVLLSSASRRVPPLEHQLFDRTPHWIEEAVSSHDSR